MAGFDVSPFVEDLDAPPSRFPGKKPETASGRELSSSFALDGSRPQSQVSGLRSITSMVDDMDGSPSSASSSSSSSDSGSDSSESGDSDEEILAECRASPAPSPAEMSRAAEPGTTGSVIAAPDPSPLTLPSNDAPKQPQPVSERADEVKAVEPIYSDIPVVAAFAPVNLPEARQEVPIVSATPRIESARVPARRKPRAPMTRPRASIQDHSYSQLTPTTCSSCEAKDRDIRRMTSELQTARLLIMKLQKEKQVLQNALTKALVEVHDLANDNGGLLAPNASTLAVENDAASSPFVRTSLLETASTLPSPDIITGPSHSVSAAMGSRPIPESRPQEQSRRASATDAVPKNAMIGEGIKADKMKIDRVPAQRKAPIRKEKAPLPVAKRKIQIEGEDFGRAKRQKDVLVTGQLRTQQDVRPAVSNPETVSNAANPTAPRGPPLSALTATRLKPPSLMKSKASAPTAAMPVQPPLPLTANNLRKWLVSTKLSDFVAIETTDGVKQPTPLVSTILTDSRAFASNNPELLRDALTLAWKGMQTPSAWQECTTQSATSGSAQEQFRALPFASNKEAVIAEALPNEEKVVILFLAVLHSVSPEVLKATTHWMKEAMTSAAVAQRDVPELCRLARALTSIFLFLQRSEDCFSLAHDILRHVENREKSTFMVDNICGLWPDAMAKCLQQDLRAAMAASFKYDFSLVLEGSTRFGTNAAFSAHSETIDDLITRLVPSFFGSATPPQTHELAQAISLLVIRLTWQDAYSLFEEIWGCKEEKLLETVELIGEIFHRGRGYSSPPSGIESIRQTLFSYLETLDVANDGVWPAAAATAQALWRISVNDERWYANLKVWLDRARFLGRDDCLHFYG